MNRWNEEDNVLNRVTKEFQYGDHRVILETGRLARQATGAVLVTMGETVVLCTVVEIGRASCRERVSYSV